MRGVPIKQVCYLGNPVCLLQQPLSVTFSLALLLGQSILWKRSGSSLNKEWKKKFVTLSNNGTLSYHSSTNVRTRPAGGLTLRGHLKRVFWLLSGLHAEHPWKRDGPATRDCQGSRETSPQSRGPRRPLAGPCRGGTRR